MFKLFSALTALSIIICLPASAMVGRLGAHSLSSIRHWQESSARNHSARRGVRHERTVHKHNHRLHGAISHMFHRSKHLNSQIRSASAPGHSYIWSAPVSGFELDDAERERIQAAFLTGSAQSLSPSTLASSDVFVNCPLHGGVFKRKASVQYIILHSTETAKEADAQRVIRSWNGRGLVHPGAQFVVDRDGVIYCTADPTYGTTHVDQRKTRFGVTNDNSIGIELVRTGEQIYTPEQMRSISCLVSYLQNRYNVDDQHIYGHGYVQPSDRSDPVSFDWRSFTSEKELLKSTAYGVR